jgi:hypothetical protein
MDLWNDAISCSYCNVSVSIRVLSPGDNGPLAQTNSVVSTTVSNIVDAVQQTLAQPVVAAPPTVVLPAPPGVELAEPAQEIDTTAASAADTIAPSDAVVDDGAAAAVPPPTAAVVPPPPPVRDTAPVPPVRARSLLPPRSDTVAASDRAPRTPVAVPALATPPAVAPAESRPLVTEIARAAAPAGAGHPTPHRAPPPPRIPPADGPYVGSTGAGHGSGPPPASPTSLLALLVFLAPGFAQWLWARAELRPRALRPGRPERPG